MGPERVRVRLSFWPDGSLRSAQATGHAGTAPRGSNVACAAVTVLLRTAYETASGYEGVVATGRAPSPGALSFEIARPPEGFAERLRGIGDFLSTGISALEREYPGLVDLEVER